MDNDDKKDEVTENAIGASIFTDVASTEDGNDDNNIKHQDITAETVEMMDDDNDDDEKKKVTENAIVTSVVTDVASTEDDNDDNNIVKHQDITAENVEETNDDEEEVTENAIVTSVVTDVASTEDDTMIIISSNIKTSP